MRRLDGITGFVMQVFFWGSARSMGVLLCSNMFCLQHENLTPTDTILLFIWPNVKCDQAFIAY